MKRQYILFLSVLLAFDMAWAEDDIARFYFTDAALLPGSETSIELCMTGSTSGLTCIEAEIQLPQGLSLVCDEDGRPVCALYRNRMSDHELMAGRLENGNLKLIVSSLGGSTIEGNIIGGTEGPLLCFSVRAAEDAPMGECLVETVGESLLVSTDAEATYSTGVTGSVLITDDPDGIAEVADEQTEQSIEGSAVVNLAGQHIADSKTPHRKLPRGIYIRGGKKVAIK